VIADVHLTPTSYVVLGLVSRMQPVTSYEMKRRVGLSIGHFWPFPHSQLYAEPTRLVQAGLLAEEVETGGRRRRRYRLTDSGRDELVRWLSASTVEHTEVRDIGMLKLFFSTDAPATIVANLAADRYQFHQSRVEEWEQLRRQIEGLASEAELATLDMGVRVERAAAEFWSETLEHAKSANQSDS
jgi:PadR family transcriptional regulator, regulatory protein AphA